jgi:isoleucyl-tRNA synthetase
MIPFMAEDIYRNLVCNIYKDEPESVHLCSFPEVDESAIDTELEENMEELLDIVVMGRAARNGASMKNRQPLSTMYVQAKKELPSYCIEIIEDELNIKNVKFVSDMSEFSSYSFKPQLKTVGPKYGKYLGIIRTWLAELDGNKAMNELNTTGSLKLTASDGAEISLAEEDLLIETKQKENYCSLCDKYLSVALDTQLTPALIEEGYVNEIISKIQTMRKDSEFDVTDHIKVSVCGNDKIIAYVKANEKEINLNVNCRDVVLWYKCNYGFRRFSTRES